MNRRHLILATLGVLAGAFGSRLLQRGAAAEALPVVMGRDTVYTSPEAAAGIEELIKAGGLPVADLFVSVASDSSEIGPLIIRTQAEADAFLTKLMEQLEREKRAN